MSKTLLFIYGTLKRGQKSDHLLAGQEFRGEATTMPLYRLYNVSWHPGMVHDDENGVNVNGELWAVDDSTIAKLDKYEGVDSSWFVREDVAVRDCFDTVQAYFYKGDIPLGSLSGSEWPFVG